MDVLHQCIAKVTALLVIGWRATEKHFLQLLLNSPQRPIPVMVVAGSHDEAKKTADRMQKAGIKGEFQLKEGGFTDFILKREKFS